MFSPLDETNEKKTGPIADSIGPDRRSAREVAERADAIRDATDVRATDSSERAEGPHRSTLAEEIPMQPSRAVFKKAWQSKSRN
jgi:hypothetical protein